MTKRLLLILLAIAAVTVSVAAYYRILVESIVLSLAGGAIGVALGYPARKAASLDPIDALRFE